MRRGRPGGVQRAAADGLRAALDGGRGGVHHRPGRLQAHAGLLQRRAHGHPGPRRGAGRPGRRSAPCCTRSTTPWPRACCSCWPATSWPSTAPRPLCEVRGLLQTLPVTGALWVAGFLAITGSPPFGLFVSELVILKGALQQRADWRWLSATCCCWASSSSAWPASSCAWPTAAPAGIAVDPERSRGAWAVVPPMALGAVVLALGLCLPAMAAVGADRGRGRSGSPVMPDALLDPQRPAGASGGLPAARPPDAFAEILTGAVEAGARLAALLAAALAGGRHAPARGPRRRRTRGCCGCSPARWRRPTPPHPALPAGALVRARDRRALGHHPGRPPVAQADPLPAHGDGAAGGCNRGHRFLPHGGRGGARGGGRPGARRGHRARPLPVPVPRGGRPSPGDLPRLPAPRRRARARAAGRTGARVHYVETLAGDTTIGHATAYCHAHGGARRAAACRRGPWRCAASPWSWSGWPTTSATWARWPATSASCRRALLRPDPRRLPEPDRAALRQPLRPRPGRARRRRASTSSPSWPGSCCGGWMRSRPTRAERWSSCSTRRRVLARFEGTGRSRPRTAAADRAWWVRPRAPAGSSATCATNFPYGIYRFAHIPICTWPSGDVFARAYVRWLEIQRSLAFLREQLRRLPAGEIRAAVPARRRRTRWSCRWSKAGAARSATWP